MANWQDETLPTTFNVRAVGGEEMCHRLQNGCSDPKALERLHDSKRLIINSQLSHNRNPIVSFSLAVSCSTYMHMWVYYVSQRLIRDLFI